MVDTYKDIHNIMPTQEATVNRDVLQTIRIISQIKRISENDEAWMITWIDSSRYIFDPIFEAP